MLKAVQPKKQAIAKHSLVCKGHMTSTVFHNNIGYDSYGQAMNNRAH